MKTNRNCILLHDRDRDSTDEELKPHVGRICAEVERAGGVAWITAGREVENYIPSQAIQAAWERPSLKGPGVFSDVFDYAKRNGQPVLKKHLFAKRIARHMKRDGLETQLDLAAQLDNVREMIRRWNGIPLDQEPDKFAVCDEKAASR